LANRGTSIGIGTSRGDGGEFPETAITDRDYGSPGGAAEVFTAVSPLRRARR